MTPRRRFWHVAGSGTAFQAGSTAVDSATVMSALVFQLTGSAIAVGAVTTILRLGWLLPQLFVGYFASKGASSMRFYIVGAFGRTLAIALLALVLWAGAAAGWSVGALGAVTLGLWALYACLSGIVGVPYNDIVARAVPSELRSRMLALRFFGGGLVALGVAVFADRLVRTLDFPISYAAVLCLAAILMALSSIIFTAMGDPGRGAAVRAASSFSAYLHEGLVTFRDDATFRRFVFAQWCGGAVLMAAPFFVVAADGLGVGFENVALLLAAHTAGALASNPRWGWCGDRRGKLSLMRGIAIARVVPNLLLVGLFVVPFPANGLLPLFLATFFVLGALANGLTIAVIGLLMEISPDDRRPAYSGYFNSVTAPAYLLPLLGGGVMVLFGNGALFAIAALAAAAQSRLLSGVDIERGSSAPTPH